MEMRENPFKLHPDDENMKNPVLFLNGHYPEEMTIRAKLRYPPIIYPTVLGKNYKVMRFVPGEIFTDMFIWLNGTKSGSYEVFINFGKPAEPEKLIFREKITLPSTKFDNEYSATICASKSDDKNCFGDPYGIHIDHSELTLCRHQFKKCIIFVSVAAKNLISPSIKTDVVYQTVACSALNGTKWENVCKVWV